MTTEKLQLKDFPYNLITNTGLIYTYVSETNEYYLTDPITSPSPEISYELMTSTREQKRISLSILVALTFIPQENKLQNIVYHIDGNPKNNHASNLMWITKSQARILSSRKRTIKKMVDTMGYDYKTAILFIISGKPLRKISEDSNVTFCIKCYIHAFVKVKFTTRLCQNIVMTGSFYRQF